MTTSKVSSLFPTESFGSVVETTAILDQLLKPEGFDKNIIADIATSLFIYNERMRIYEDASMHLIAIKKTLLYAIPVITPPNSTSGILITSQVNTPAIQLKNDKIKHIGLVVGDKFRLLGFAFPDRLINHLAFSIFPQKYFDQPPESYKIQPLKIEHINGIIVKKIAGKDIYIIDPKQYENTELFNLINKLLSNKLMEEITPLIASNIKYEDRKFQELQRITPYNDISFINQLNEILERKIDRTYTMSLYEALYMTANWLMYDYISLLGFESPEVKEKLKYLAYVKEQNYKVRQNIRDNNYKKLLSTRAEKICREKYPFFFDFTDSRSIFIKFNQFDINKLPKKEQQDIQLLLEKELDTQSALLLNNCEHLKHVKSINTILTEETYKNIESFIDFDSLGPDGMYPCKLCKYPLLCVHTVELYDALSSIGDTTDNSDKIYWIKQKIINKYKLINQKNTGQQDTETLFTYYCKHCSGELGKTDDIIQASVKTQDESNEYMESSPYDRIIYMNIANTMNQHMNSETISLNPKVINSMIAMEIKDEIIGMAQRSNYNDESKTDLLIRYLSQVYTLVSLISININKIKSQQSALISKDNKIAIGGANLKDELLIAFKIIKSVSSYKQIGVTDEKIKTILIDAFKFVNKIFSNEAIVLKSVSAQDKLIMDIKESPLVHYAKFIYNRFEKKSTDEISVTGIDINKLYPKKKNAERISTHALYTNIYEPSIQAHNDTERFIQESYKSLTDLAKTEPIAGLYLSLITPNLSEFVNNYQLKLSKHFKLKRTVPIRFLPVINTREYDYKLKIFQLAYCLTDPIQPHRWNVTKKNDKLEYRCKYCNITIDQASISNNDKIEDKLADQRIKEAFFELYTISCPIKDAHIFENEECVKCGITKEKINTKDEKYYKKYYNTYLTHRQRIIDAILSDVKKIVLYASPFENKEHHKQEKKFDELKLESVASNLGKIFNKNKLELLGLHNNSRSIDVIRSYVRTFYSYYTFAKNISSNVSNHHDLDFFKLVKHLFFNGANNKQSKLKQLPTYPESDNADELLLQLLSIILEIVNNSDSTTNELVGYILKKIILQDERYKDFDFAKLKALPVSDDIDIDMINDSIDQIQDEKETDMFDGYDIDADDAEDNINGYTD